MPPAESKRISNELVEEALRQGQAVRDHFCDQEYVRFGDDFHGVHRGTVVIEGRVLPAYPSIGRIFALARGIRNNLPGRFHAEEKLDGYNIRLIRSNGRLLPFTRGGFVCPFTEDRITDLGDFEPLFDENADAVLCGEVVGPENPYMHSRTPHARGDVAFFAFDLMRLGSGSTVALSRRDEIFARAGLTHAPFFGWFTADDVPKIRDLILQLDAQGSEGIVFKPEAEGVRVKYVTPAVNVADIELDGELLAELPAEFFLGRLLRLAISLEELHLEDRVQSVEDHVGHALVSGFLPVLREVASGGKVAQLHTVRLHSAAAADRVVRHLDRASHKVQVREIERRSEGGWIHLTFEKTFLESTSRLKTFLEGDYVID